MLVRLENPGLLSRVVEIISELVTEVRMKVNESGLSITAMDPANVSMVKFVLPKSSFSMFETDNEVLGINLENLKRVLKRSGPGSSLIMEKKGNVLNIQIHDRIKRNFNLALIEIESEEKEINQVIAAAIAHMEIAAIHPFNDGNGRTARALATLILYQRGYDFRRLFALEDYYNTDRPSYYKAINLGKTYDERRTDITSWLEYFVTGFKEEIDEVKTKILPLAGRAAARNIESRIYLTPEQLKIIDWLDQMGRISVKDVEELLSCPRRTAQLQLQKLKKPRGF